MTRPRRIVPLLLALWALVICPAWAAPAEDDDADLQKVEVSIGRDASRQYERTVRVVARGPEVDRLRRILKKIAPLSGRPGLPYSVKIVESPQVNAITFPGGFIYFYRGLLAQKPDEAMLAAVMAHEVVHAAKSHSYRKMMQMKALGLLTGGQDGLVSGVSKVLLLSGVGRTYETQADRLGVRLLAKAGYDASAMVRVLQLLQRLDSENPGLLSSLVATHPPTADRIKKVKAELAPKHAETQRRGAGLQ